MITFELKFTNGSSFNVTDNENNILQTVVDNFFMKQFNKKFKIIAGMHSAEKVDFQKTLSENQIKNGSIVLLLISSDELADFKLMFNSSMLNQNPSNLMINQNMMMPPMMSQNMMMQNQNPSNLMMNQNMMMQNQNPSNLMVNQNMMMQNQNPSNLMMNQNMMTPMMNQNMMLPNTNSSNTTMNPMMMQPEMNQNMMIPSFDPIPMNSMESSSMMPMKNETQTLLICMNFLMNICKIPPSFFSPQGNCFDNSWRINGKNGPPEYLKEYYPPLGWYGIGLKAWDLYDNKDNTWLGSSNKPGEWYIAYHPISSISSIMGILNNGFRKGPFQECSDYDNINPLTKNNYPQCLEGVYFIPEIIETEKYAKQFNYLNYKLKLCFMCRINPYAVRICYNDENKESWIVNGDILNDPNGRKRDEEVRIYRILLLLMDS